jgi:hypothetical protein
MVTAFTLAVGMILWLPLAALNGWVLSVLWGWFVVPTFSLAPLSVPQAIGLALITTALTYHIDTDTKTERHEPVASLIAGVCAAVIKPLFALFAGWVYLIVFF